MVNYLRASISLPSSAHLEVEIAVSMWLVAER